MGMKKDKDPTSPFLKQNEVKPLIITENNPRVINSPVHDIIYE